MTKKTRDLVKSWTDGAPEDELQLVMERADQAGMSLGDYIRAELAGKPTERAVPWTKFALAGTDDTVGPECRQFLKRPDILECVELPTGMVVCVLEGLAEADPTLANVSRADLDVLKEVRDVWRARHNKLKRRGVALRRSEAAE